MTDADVEHAHKYNPPEERPVGARCNRSACQSMFDVHYWNPSTRAWYCGPCSRLINKFNPGLCIRVQP